MPSFFPSALHTLPPTPPHIHVGGRMEADQSYFSANHAAFPPRYARNGCDFIEQYSQNCYANPLAGSHGQSMRSVNGGGDIATAHPVMAQQTLSQTMFGPLAAAPVLPPIRPNMKLPPMESAIPPHYRHQESLPQPEQRPKDEKATGGVAAHLDYDMEQMSDFVAEMAQGMYALYISKITLADIDFARSVYPGTSVPPQFRKYVLQVLSSTRLPSSTILLGLYYLASRMRQLSSAGVYTSGSAQVYRMLTTALLLGSKFLDDNTFQNRSWAEVSNIPVAKLNSMELDWLKGFDWKIHERIHNQQDGFMTWKSHWDNWRSKVAARANDHHKLTPIDTNIQKQNLAHKALLSPEGPIPPQYQRSTHLDHSWLNPVASEYSPPSAPHSGPNTPDYYSAGPWGYANPPPPYSRGWVPPTQQYISQPAPRSQPPSYHHTPSYTQSFAHNVWTGHGSSCGCLYCAKHHEHMFTASAFGIQPVAG